MRLLLVEDSQRLQTYVGKGLRQAGFAVDSATDGEEGLWLAKENDYDVIVLDLMIPKLSGLEVLQRLRDLGRDTHVLILTAMDAVEDRVLGLQAGADDYLVKPFAFEELLARVQVLARRAYGVKKHALQIGPLHINLLDHTAQLGPDPIDLRPREYALLELLALRQGEVVSRTEIEQHIYDERAEPVSNVVDAAICTLRKKLGRKGQPPLIHTRRGMGYVLQDPGL